MSQVLLLNKPFRVLSQFTDDQERSTLSSLINTKRFPGFYAAGRLDYDSEGLLLLTNDGKLQQRIADPKFKLPKTYWVQVEGEIDDTALLALQRGVKLNDGMTKPAKAARLSQIPGLWERAPPVRFRQNKPTSWVELTITEGRNRQVRRMTAACGFPTLRLIRYAIGNWTIKDLTPGQFSITTVHMPATTNKTTNKRR